jgi:hypothetical protein
MCRQVWLIWPLFCGRRRRCRRECGRGCGGVVGVVEGVDLEVGARLAAQAAEAWVEVARERGAPALVEDRLVQRLDVVVGLRAARGDAGVAGVELGGGCRELVLNSLPFSLSRRLSAQSASLSSATTWRAKALVWNAVGLPFLAIASSAHANDEQTSIAGQLPDRALGALQTPDVEAVDADRFTWALDVNVRSEPGSRGGLHGAA